MAIIKSQRIYDLEALITNAAQQYYLGEATVSDEQFDMWVDELKLLNPTNSLLSVVGWGHKVYGDKIKLPCEIKHSLDKYFNSIDINNALNNTTQIVITPKLDGLSALLQYDDNGYLILACTRGDGIYGVDITQKIIHLHSSAELMRGPFNTVVRGELVISKSSFTNLAGYANPRNAAAGIINSKSFDNLNLVEFISHDFHDGFYGRVVDHHSVDLQLNDDDLSNLYNKFKSQEYPYQVDGLVLFPVFDTNNKIAYKGKTDRVVGTVKKVHWNLSDTLQLVPVVELEERFTLYGTSVGDSISAFNAGYVRDEGIGPGSLVEVTKANEIIPYITKIVSRSSPEIPSIWDEHPTYWDGCRLFVKNDHKELEQRINRFLSTYFTTEGAVDVDKLRKAFNISAFIDIYNILNLDPEVSTGVMRGRLFNYKENNQRFTSPQVESIIPLFNKDRTLDSKWFLYSLGLRNVGESLSNRAANYLDLIDKNDLDVGLYARDNFIRAINAPSHSAESIRNNWNFIVKIYNLFENRLVKVESRPEEILIKEYVVLTGSMSKKRSEIVKELSSVGVGVLDGISPQVKYLVQSDPSSQSSKSKAAKSMNIAVISEFDMRKIYGLP